MKEADAIAAEARAREQKPILRGLVRDLVHAADMSTDRKRADELETLAAALTMGLPDPRGEDITFEQAETFRQVHGIPKRAA